ncbi:FG-GAP repeat domain-containing protein [Sinisalibacter aestuarii]|uniref:VCBS repeat-containing protein n=1 Tax=Sinisalibacter aestuarii TaxID=2949426 RepID=A0ABQ5LPU8_9RHOB|nr:VCBS repeat-containing protein [Sinisalibacter aestuarii]GKY87032.1 hypothetical protein STA1M1_09010 [Sinisalibacter aestuarii]
MSKCAAQRASARRNAGTPIAALAVLAAATAAWADPGGYRRDDGLGTRDPRDFTMDIAQGDVDGDGHADLVLALEFAPNILLLGDGTGRFRDAEPGWAPREVHDSEDAALGDVDGDGDLDLVVVSEDDRTDSYLLNDGSGRFRPSPWPLPVAGISNAVIMADMDSDGDLDLVIGNNGPNVLLLNDGRGRFRVDPGFPGGAQVTQDLALGDVTGDGLADIVVANEGRNSLLVALGGGRFADASETLLAGQIAGETRDAELIDVDGDGDLDLYLANVSLFSDLDSQDRLLINDGTGHFTDETSARLPADSGSTMDAAAADLDGDGTMDIVLARFGDLTGRSWSTPLAVLTNDGTGHFTGVAGLLPGDATANGMHVEVIDLAGGGRPMLAIASRGGPDFLLVPVNR